jgi:hypothetical protein
MDMVAALAYGADDGRVPVTCEKFAVLPLSNLAVCYYAILCL